MVTQSVLSSKNQGVIRTQSTDSVRTVANDVVGFNLKALNRKWVAVLLAFQYFDFMSRKIPRVFVYNHLFHLFLKEKGKIKSLVRIHILHYFTL